MDIKAKIEELTKKITSDKTIMEKFKSDPIKTVEGLIGIDLPDDQVNQLIEGIKAKIKLDKLGGALGGGRLNEFFEVTHGGSLDSSGCGGRRGRCSGGPSPYRELRGQAGIVDRRRDYPPSTVDAGRGRGAPYPRRYPAQHRANSFVRQALYRSGGYLRENRRRGGA